MVRVSSGAPGALLRSWIPHASFVSVLGILTAASLAAPGGAPAQEGESWRVDPEPALQIGKVSGEQPYLFQSIRTARFLSDGHIVVADGGQTAIRVFGPEGEFQHAIGGQGEGPGEFERVGGMWLTSDGRIGVWDPGLKRISTFTPAGEVESTARVQGRGEISAGNLEVFLGAYPDDDLALATLQPGERAGPEQAVPDPWVAGRFARDGSIESVLGELRGMRRAAGQPLPFTPLPFAALHADSMFVSDGYGAEIRVLNGSGDEIRTLELPSADVPGEDAWTRFRKILMKRGEAGLLKRLQGLPDRDRVPQIGGLLIDSRGLLWVKRYEPTADALYVKEGNALGPTTGGMWRVFRRDGQLVARVRMPEGVAPLQIEDDRILGLSRDELDVQRVVVHRLER